MAQQIFGMDIGQIVTDALDGAGGLCPAILYKETLSNTPLNPKDVEGHNTKTGISTPYRTEGIATTKQVYKGETRGSEAELVVYFEARKLSVEPQPGDRFHINGRNLILGEMRSFDPAETMYEFAAKPYSAAVTRPVGPQPTGPTFFSNVFDERYFA